jgi:hypothetical protein
MATNFREELGLYLTHYGVPGMKWGIRKAGQKEPRISRKKRKADKKWEDNITKSNPVSRVYNKAVDKINPTVDSFTTAWKKANKDKKDLRKKENLKSYEEAFKSYFDDLLNESVNELYGSISPSGTKKVVAYTEKFGDFPILELLELVPDN